MEEFCFTVWQNGTADADQPFQIKRQGCVANHGGSQVIWNYSRLNTHVLYQNTTICHCWTYFTFFLQMYLKGFATFWEFSFYGQKKVAYYEYHSLFAEKIHFHT